METSLIHSVENMRQIISFDGMVFYNTWPSNIDAIREFKNSCWTIIEAKYQKSEMPNGQALMFERLHADLSLVKPTLLIIASHNTKIGSAVDLKNTTVIKFKYKNDWVIDGKRKAGDLEEQFCMWVRRYRTVNNDTFLPK